MAKSRFAAAATALLLVPGAFSALVISTDAQARESADCEAAAQVAVLPAPMAPWKGAPLRVIFAAEKPINGELALIAPDGTVAAKSGSSAIATRSPSKQPNPKSSNQLSGLSMQ